MAPAPAAGSARGGALVVLLVAVNLRAGVVAVSPVLGELRADTGLSSAGAGLLTTLPVLCFGLFALLAPRLGRRFGVERTTTAALGLLTAALLVRGLPGLPALFAGTLLLGAAIAVSNVLLPALIKRDFPLRVEALTGLYITVMSCGAVLAAGATVPLEEATGLGWRPALALWALPALAAMLTALVLLRRPGGAGAGSAGSAVRGLWRDRVAWQVTTFMGLQSLGFYASLAWLPTIFTDTGLPARTAGLLLAAGSLVSLPASLLAPALATRLRDERLGIALSAALTASGLAGLAVAPGTLPLAWMLLLGLGQGSSIALALTMVGQRSPDAAHAGQLSSMAQGVGYLIAASGPLALGVLHGATGGWGLPLGLLLALVVPQLLAGLGAARPRLVAAGAAALDGSASSPVIGSRRSSA